MDRLQSPGQRGSGGSPFGGFLGGPGNWHTAGALPLHQTGDPPDALWNSGDKTRDLQKPSALGMAALRSSATGMRGMHGTHASMTDSISCGRLECSCEGAVLPRGASVEILMEGIGAPLSRTGACSRERVRLLLVSSPSSDGALPLGPGGRRDEGQREGCRIAHLEEGGLAHPKGHTVLAPPSGWHPPFSPHASLAASGERARAPSPPTPSPYRA